MSKPLDLEILPPVRRNVFKHSLYIVGLYVLVGIFMMAAVFLASGATPKAIHLNYDSISAANQMGHSWNALKNPKQYSRLNRQEWIQQFENALHFEEGNITEPGEKEATQAIRDLWSLKQKAEFQISDDDFQKMDTYLDRLTQVNETGMFAWASKSQIFGRNVFIATVILFLITIAIALFLADSLAVKIATPLRDLSRALKNRTEPGSKLKLPKPLTIEIKILTSALMELWQRVSELQALNLDEIALHRKKLETVLSSVEDAILVLDQQNQIVQCNEGFANFLKVAPVDLSEKDWRDLPYLSENYLSLRSALTPDLSSDHSFELEVKGNKRVFAARYRAILDEKNQKVGNLYLLHDITEIKQKDRLGAEFIGVLSHELKTPLQSLGTASELLLKRKEQFNPDEIMLIETIHEDFSRIRGVANEFIQVGTSNLHSLRLKFENAAIDQLLPQWIQPFQLLAKDKNIRIIQNIPNQGGKKVKLDSVKFSWAIANLLSNALRVSPNGTTLTVSLLNLDHGIQITIQDEGPGISDEVQKRMFEPYYQGNHATLEKIKGFMGLGLTITKEVVEAHEGKLTYQRLAPQGSLFKIELPEVR